jgi:hypothetical protein
LSSSEESDCVEPSLSSSTSDPHTQRGSVVGDIVYSSSLTLYWTRLEASKEIMTVHSVT